MKNKTGKRIASLMLSICMILTLAPVAAFADDGTESETTKLETDIATLGEYLDNYIGIGLIMNKGHKVSEPLNADSPSKVKDVDIDDHYQDAQEYNMIRNFGVVKDGDVSASPTAGFAISSDYNDIYINSGTTAGKCNSNHSINIGANGKQDNTDKKKNVITATVKLDNNDTLLALAAGGTLQFRLNGQLCGDKFARTAGTDDNSMVKIELTVLDEAGNEKVNKSKETTSSDGEHNKWFDSGWVELQAGYVIEIKITVWGDLDELVGFTEAGLFFRDLDCPTLKNYDLETNGAEYYNTASEKREVLLKRYGVEDRDDIDENDPGYIDFSLNFSEPVKTSLSGAKLSAGDDRSLLDQLENHIMFTNPSNTGYENMGDPVKLKLDGVTYADGTEKTTESDGTQNGLLCQYDSAWHYRWTAGAGDYSNNQPIQAGCDWYGSETYNNDYSLINKVYLASLHDAAGNPLVRIVNGGEEAVTKSIIDAIGDTNTPGEGILSGDILITDTAVEGSPSAPAVINSYEDVDMSPMSYLDFIIDAVKPTYSVTSNGIQPDILSQVVLNNNDKITFLVNFSESVIVKRYKADGHTATGYATKDTYLRFKNGMKAYYVSGYGTKQWTFSMTIDDSVSAEVGTLEAEALASDEHPADTFVLTDYVGNPLDLSAGSTDNRSSIAWAKLSIDNTEPDIAFSSGSGWNTSADVTVTASDPDLADGSKSKGVFHIANTTSGEDNAKGLIYYLWLNAAGTDENENGVDDSIDTAVLELGANNYAAVKKYSLTATQPDGYTGTASDVGALVVTNNESKIAAPASICADEESGQWYLLAFTADMTWDSARQLVQYKKLESYKESADGKAAYLAWINAYETDKGITLSESIDEASNDAIYYADQQGMTAVGDYSEWTAADYQSDDSNWTYEYQLVKLDNTRPTLKLISISGSGTSDSLVTVSASDEDSGLDTFSYQFVSAGETYSEAAWKSFEITAGDNSADKTASTAACSLVDGTYDLYGKAVDTAGNETVLLLAEDITVDTSKTVVGEFNIDSNASGAAVKSITGLTFSAGAAKGSQSLSITISYAVTDSVTVPTEWTGTLESSGSGDSINGVATAVYKLPDITDTDGIKYVHIKVLDEDGATATFHIAYKLDNTAPTVSFSPDGVSYAQGSVSVTVSAADDNNGKAVKYMWVADGAEAPTTSTTEGWTELDSLTFITSSEDLGELVPDGETVPLRLYVYATDEAGNVAVTASDEPFLFFLEEDVPALTGVAGALKSIYESASGDYRAVVQLTMPETVYPGDYDYSIAVINADGTTTWSRWMPYESMAGVSLGESSSLSGKQIWVKFRSVTGSISDEDDYIKLSGADLTVQSGDVVWAAVSRDKLKKIAAGGKVNLELTVPEGVTATVDQDGVSGSGTSYTVTKNGYYAFAISDGTNEDTLYVAVNNFDSTPPVGSITYSTLDATSGDVTAFLSASEDIAITNNNGSYAHTFTDNGQFDFVFQDEAGNSATCTANVTWIDKTAPEFEINVGYSYTSGSKSYSYGTIVSGGQVVLAQGAVLTAVSTGDKAITVVSGADSAGEDSKKATENGSYQFVVSDSLGNTTAAGQTIENIISSVEAPEISVSYADADTNAAVDTIEINGVEYANSPNAAALVTASGTIDGYALGNRLYDGGIKNEGSDYSNLISSSNTLSGSAEYSCDASGNYTVTKPYTANGNITAYLCDALGNKVKYKYTVSGLDKQAPAIDFDGSALWIDQRTDVPALGDDWWVSQGGYTVSDNVSSAEKITVSVDASALNSDTAGSYPVTYTATDQVGNSSQKVRTVYVLPADGLLVRGDGILIYSGSTDVAILEDNSIQLSVSRYDLMDYGVSQDADGTWNTTTVTNEAATYDVYIQKGLYREGQLKYIQTVSFRNRDTETITITPDELTSSGWYTIIVRNSEREREYTTFFISAVSNS